MIWWSNIGIRHDQLTMEMGCLIVFENGVYYGICQIPRWHFGKMVSSHQIFGDPGIVRQTLFGIPMGFYGFFLFGMIEDEHGWAVRAVFQSNDVDSTGWPGGGGRWLQWLQWLQWPQRLMAPKWVGQVVSLVMGWWPPPIKSGDSAKVFWRKPVSQSFGVVCGHALILNLSWTWISL